jgi:predicted DNA-binding ArsR family transcriptional regulator
MPTVHFMGYVEPRNIHLMMENLNPVTERDKATGYVTTFTIAIIDSVVSVECEVDEVRREYISNLYTRSYEITRTLVNLVSLKMGWGLKVYLETYIAPDGKEETLMTRMDSIRGLFTSYDLNQMGAFFDLMVSDVNLYMALDDLVEAISTPRVATTNCARVIDAIRHLISPQLKDKAGWTAMREALNADESYLQLISNKSKLSRHGKHEYLTSEEAQEIIARACIITDRYLHYRIQYKDKLPLNLFPQLTNAQTLKS